MELFNCYDVCLFPLSQPLHSDGVLSQLHPLHLRILQPHSPHIKHTHHTSKSHVPAHEIHHSGSNFNAEMFIYWRMRNLAWLLLTVFFTVSPSTSTRILNHQPPPPHGSDRAITFFMNDVLGSRRRSSRPAAGTGAPPPIPKPMGGRPSPTHPTAVFAGQNGPPNKSWLPLLTSLHALESGTVTMIDEKLRGSVALGPPTAGKVQGMYVTSSGDNSSHMVAMKATFEDGRSDDSLRFFGVHRLGLSESHIAVVGGTGRYHGANGFAVVRATGGRENANRVLSVTVYLK